MLIPFQIGKETIYLICQDDNNYALARKRERTRDGVTTSELESFKWYADIGAALNRIIDLKCKRSEATTLQELKQVIVQSRKEVLEAWQAKA